MDILKVKKNSDKNKIIFLATSCLLILIMFKLVPRMFIPFFIAYLLFLIVNPLLNFLQRSTSAKRMRVIVVVLTVGFLTAYLLIDSVLALQNEAENFETVYYKAESAIREKYFSLRTAIRYRFNYDLNSKILEQGLALSQETLKSLITNIPNYISYLFEWMLLV